MLKILKDKIHWKHERVHFYSDYVHRAKLSTGALYLQQFKFKNFELQLLAALKFLTLSFLSLSVLSVYPVDLPFLNNEYSNPEMGQK